MTSAVRAALRTPARDLVLALEAAGGRLTVTAGRVRVQPGRLVTAVQRQQLRQHAAAVHTLVEHRADWCAWPQPVPTFNPRQAFLSADEIRGRTA